MNCSYFSKLWGHRRNKNRYFETKYKVEWGVAIILNLISIVSKDNSNINLSINSVLSIPGFALIFREK